jgi:transposase
MDLIETLKQEARQGRISAERLVDLLATQQRQLLAIQQQLQEAQQQLLAVQQQLLAAQQRLAELDQQAGGAPTAKLDEPFSLRAEEQRQQARGKKKPKQKKKGRRGRFRTQDKIAQAERTETVFPDGVPPNACHLSHVRPVWRLEQGRAVLVAYEVYRGPNDRYGVIPGVLGRSEFGLEIVTEIAYLVYIVGLSFDKVCLLLQFFQNLKLRKSQADALLYQLSRHWQQEFETLCTLLAHSMVVHADETSWSLSSVWAFLSEKARVLLFGVPKDAATLKLLLDPATFAGLVISDDAAVYENFSAAQKCWAHLLRKGIKLTLQAPDNADYRAFTDRLLEIYRQACRVQGDGRLGDAGRARQVASLDDAIVNLCAPYWFADVAPEQGLDHDFHLLAKEVFRLMIKQELFQFVTAPPLTQPNGVHNPVGGTNNEAERTLRGAAQARLTGRTNKTHAGARRQTILTTVLESLRLYLKTFTLASVLEELKRWWTVGQSCFAKLLAKLKLTVAEEAIIDQLLPRTIPTG